MTADRQRERSTIEASFPVIDDVLLQVSRYGTLSVASFELAFANRLGPLVELYIARESLGSALAPIKVTGRAADRLHDACANGTVIGTEFEATIGVFPLVRLSSDADRSDHWDLWLLRLQYAAQRIGFTKRFAQGLAGAAVELVSNIEEHSGRPDSGLVAFQASTVGFEIVVADAGIGVLTALRRNRRFEDLRDSGEALRTAASDGVSSIEGDSGRGYGISQLFRALAGQNGEVRFRSGDHALTVRGAVLNLEGSLEIAQRATIAGLTVSVLCRPSEAP